jgi:hypothetical protein
MVRRAAGGGGEAGDEHRVDALAAELVSLS